MMRSGSTREWSAFALFRADVRMSVAERRWKNGTLELSGEAPHKHEAVRGCPEAQQRLGQEVLAQGSNSAPAPVSWLLAAETAWHLSA